MLISLKRHNGVCRPVDPESTVMVKNRRGRVFVAKAADTYEWIWGTRGTGEDIIGYLEVDLTIE